MATLENSLLHSSIPPDCTAHHKQRNLRMSTQQPPSPDRDDEDVRGLPQRFRARIVGLVQHRVGDGPLESIPKGQDVLVDLALASMVVSWTSDGQPITVTLAREEFLEYVDTGAIHIQA